MFIDLFLTIEQVFEGTSGIDNKFTTVQFTGEVKTQLLLLSIWKSTSKIICPKYVYYSHHENICCFGDLSH